MDDITRPNSDSDETGKDRSQNTRDDEINLADYLQVLIKHRRVIFWVCVIVVTTTGVIGLFLPETYIATTSVVPPIDVLQRGATTGLGAVKSPLLRQAMDVTSIADMYVGILRSRSVVDALIKKFDLATAYGIESGMSALREILHDSTSVEVTDEGIVNITVEDSDPCRAAALANAYVEELDRQNKRLFVGQAANKKIFLKNRLREIEQELSHIENLLSREAKIKEMLFELLTKEYEIAKIEEAKSMPTIQVLDEAIVPENNFKPKRVEMILLAGLTSVCVSVFAAFILERFTYQRAGDF